MSSPDKMKL